MCGIFGVIAIGSEKPVDPRSIARMGESIRHRGPDDDGLWLSDDGGVVLGHRRLSIIDLSPAGKQPMGNEDGRVVITYNGEIYNYRELRHSLIGRGHTFSSRTDTETIVHAYEDSGTAVVAELDGDFAFALWDADADRLFLARDRAGVKPLYYANVGGHFLFASEVRALLASGLVAAEIDEVSLYHYLTYLVSPPGRTMIRGIHKLEMGAALTLRRADGALRHWRYWEPLPGRYPVDPAGMTEQFDELFGRAVAKRMMSDVPIGVLFSGGVDSTLNAGMFLRAANGRDVHTYTVGMPGTAYDESDRARSIAHRLMTKHHEVALDRDTVLAELDELIGAQDEPLADPVCLPLYYVSKLARGTGTIVLQAGEGADETFCGYDSYLRYLRVQDIYQRYLKHLPAPVTRGLASAVDTLSILPNSRRAGEILSRISCGKEFFHSSALGFLDREKKAVLAPDLARASNGLDSYDVVQPFYQRLRDEAKDATFLQSMTFVELNVRLSELLLMRVDKMSMAHSLEVRVPFLDHRLIEFAMSVPDAFKLDGGVAKAPVKRAAARFLDRDQVYRPKRGFGAPILEWFRGPLTEALLETMADGSADASRYFSVPRLRARLQTRPRSHREAFQLWVVFLFLRWVKLGARGAGR